MKVKEQKIHLPGVGVIGICFLLTSTAYLAWTYHIMELVKAPISEVVTLIIGYLFQAAGVGLFSLMIRRREDLPGVSVYAALILHMIFLVPAVLGSSFIQAAAFGCAMNLLCGWIAGYYLYRLTTGVSASCSAMTLGAGYSAAIVVSWVLSVLFGGALYHSIWILIVCFALTAAAFFILRTEQGRPDAQTEEMTEESISEGIRIPKETELRKFLILAGALVLVFSIVNSCGFGFPSGDVEKGISVEFSRLFYAAGLLIAGYVNDRNRRYGAICAVAVLVIPFLMMAIRGEPVSLLIFWVLSYFTFGFYTIYRIILFSDIARGKGLIPLCGFGLLIGRIGDAAGEALCLAMSGHFVIFVGLTAILYMAAVLLFFRVYLYIYQPEVKQPRSEQEIFNRFSARHDLSAREREVLRFLLEEKTNKEIAEELSISEGTVKYHIHNLLQKTSCRNRLGLLSAFTAEQDI
ncbi:MAG: hypothetical protein J6D46_01020 [Lachnospiraceae bacterium]|nr:hypothetical protein [Lachnospiraceae bacterium]